MTAFLSACTADEIDQTTAVLVPALNATAAAEQNASAYGGTVNIGNTLAQNIVATQQYRQENGITNQQYEYCVVTDWTSKITYMTDTFAQNETDDSGDWSTFEAYISNTYNASGHLLAGHCFELNSRYQLGSLWYSNYNNAIQHGFKEINSNWTATSEAVPQSRQALPQEQEAEFQQGIEQQKANNSLGISDTDDNGCVFLEPQNDLPGAITWNGSCSDGYVDGPGMLIQISGNMRIEYFGTFLHGRFVHGTEYLTAVATGLTWIAANFSNGFDNQVIHPKQYWYQKQ